MGTGRKTSSGVQRFNDDNKQMVLGSSAVNQQLWGVDLVVLGNNKFVYFRDSVDGALYGAIHMDTNNLFIIGNYYPGKDLQLLFRDSLGGQYYLAWREHDSDQIAMLRHDHDWFITADGTLTLETESGSDGDLIADIDGAIEFTAGGVRQTMYVPLTTPLTNTSWDGDDTKTSGNNGTIDLSSVFGAPPGIKAVNLHVLVYSSSVGDSMTLGPGSGKNQALCRVDVASQNIIYQPVVNCDSNGDIYAAFAGSVIVKIEIWGYWI